MENKLWFVSCCLSFYVITAAEDFLIFQKSLSVNSPTPISAVSTTPTRISDWVLVNNRPVIGTMAPFVAQAPPTPEFLDCFGRCPTTSEYNPICGSNMQVYLNEQKFNCARACGADIQIVRRGSCQGLFQMQRG